MSFLFLRGTVRIVREHKHQQAQIFLPEIEGSIAAGHMQMEIVFGILERFHIPLLLPL